MTRKPVNRKVRVFVNPDYGDEMCPSCTSEFIAPFGMAVCRECGFVSWGCGMCPLDKFSCCGTAKCPIERKVELYAIFTQKEFDSLPEQYRIYAPTKSASFAILMIDNKIQHIYTERKIVGFTTLDMYEWRRGNHSLKGRPKAEEVVYSC